MNFNGKFWHKPGHLGMTTDEVKAALKALPTPEAGDAGKAVVVNEAEDGYILGPAGGGGDSYDLVIKHTGTAAFDTTKANYAIESGSLDTIRTIVSNGGVPKIKIYGTYTVGATGSGVGIGKVETINLDSANELTIYFSHSPNTAFDNYELYFYQSALSTVRRKSVALSS